MEEVKNKVGQFFDKYNILEIDDFKIQYLSELNNYTNIDDKILFSKILIINFKIVKKKLTSEKKQLITEYDKIKNREQTKQNNKKIYFIQNDINNLIKEKKSESEFNIVNREKSKPVLEPIKENKEGKIVEQNVIKKKAPRNLRTKKYVATTTKNMDRNFHLPFSLSQIVPIDKEFNIDTEVIINELNNSKNKEEKINEIMAIYSNIFQQLKEQYDIKKSHLNGKQPNTKMNLMSTQMSMLKCLIEKLELYKKKVCKKNISPVKKLEFDEEIEITDTHHEIEYKIRNKKPVKNYKLKDVIISIAKYISKCEPLEDKDTLINYNNDLSKLLEEYFYNNGTIDEFHYLLDVLKSKINLYNKDSEERMILKNILKKYQDIYNIYGNNNLINDNKNPYFNIINYWLQDEKNYLYIKELLKRQPAAYNCYNDNQHIVIYLLDRYIENFKKMIADKNSNYINKNYIKEVYFLFTKNYKIKLTNEQKKEIDQKLKGFMYYIKDTIIKEKRKNVALAETKSMRTEYYYPMTTRYQFGEITDDSLVYEQQRIFNYSKELAHKSPVNPAFVIGNNAYNISRNKESIILKMYSIDLHNFTLEKSTMNYYLESCAFNGEEPDEFFTKKFKFRKNGKYPTLCYSLEFYPNGRIKSLKINNDFVVITNKYNTIYNMNDDLTKFYDLYKKSIIKNGGIATDYDIYKINEHFEQLLNQKYIEFIRENNLPFIYYGYSLPEQKEIETNLCDLSPYFYDLDKKNANDLINIISSPIDKFHYSIVPIENGVYDLKLIDSFNYFGLENQRMLGDLYFNQRQLENPTRLYKLKLEYLKKYYEKVMEINSALGYIDRYEIKESKGKIKRKLKI